MAEDLLGVVRAFRAAVVGFEPGVYTGEACAELVEELAVAEKACAAARVRAAARAAAYGAHRERGYADASDWLARATGTSAAAAKNALDAAAALEELPEARSALEAGELSLAQVQELLKAEGEQPGSATELLDHAKDQSLKVLKEEVRRRRLAAIDPEELHSLQHRAKTFRHWRTGLGTVGFSGELPPEIGLPIVNRLDAETDRLWQQSKHHAGGSCEERRSAIAADAFVRLVETGGKGKTHSADLVIVCDLQAYRRGHAHERERCHIVDGGPIPVTGATTWRSTTETRWPTVARRPSPTSGRCAGPITGSRPSVTARPGSSGGSPEVPIDGDDSGEEDVAPRPCRARRACRGRRLRRGPGRSPCGSRRWRRRRPRR